MFWGEAGGRAAARRPPGSGARSPLPLVRCAAPPTPPPHPLPRPRGASPAPQVPTSVSELNAEGSLMLGHELFTNDVLYLEVRGGADLDLIKT